MNARKTSKRVASLWDYTPQKVPSDNSDPEETWGRDVFGEGQHGVAKAQRITRPIAMLEWDSPRCQVHLG